MPEREARPQVCRQPKASAIQRPPLGKSGCVVRSRCEPPDPAGLFSEGSEVIQRHIEGSLTIPNPWIKRVITMETKVLEGSSTGAGSGGVR